MIHILKKHFSSHAWWKYAVCELRPQLRSHLHSKLGQISLSDLVTEARNNLIYVQAYQTYLIQGLIERWSLGNQKLSKSEFLSSNLWISSKLDFVQAHQFRLERDKEWKVQRISILRLVTMRRVASMFHQVLVILDVHLVAVGLFYY